MTNRPGRDHIRILMRNGVLVLFLLILCNFLGLCSEWPDCKFQCRAGDVSVGRVWLGDSTGGEIYSCQPQSRVEAYLWVQFDNNANSPRYAVILLADIYINGELRQSLYDSGLCVMDSIPPKSSITLPVYSMSYNCGDDVRLSRLVLSWETSRGTTCSDAARKCANRNTKCYGGSDTEIVVVSPLVADFEFEGSGCPGIAYYFSAEVHGGKKPYAFHWDFGDGSASDEENPSHRFAATGSYQVKLSVSDSSGTTVIAGKSVSVRSCRCGIEGSDTACTGRNETYSAMLEDVSWESLIWMIDGREVGPGGAVDERTLDVDWSYYGVGQHSLELIAGLSGSGGIIEAARCNMTVRVIESPIATFSMVV